VQELTAGLLPLMWSSRTGAERVDGVVVEGHRKSNEGYLSATDLARRGFASTGRHFWNPGGLNPTIGNDSATGKLGSMAIFTGGSKPHPEDKSFCTTPG
jgi:hypothetical protein